MTVSTNASLKSCKQNICTTLLQKYVRVFKTGKWDTVVAKPYFCYFPCLSAWNATFIPQLGEFDDDAFLLFPPRLKIHVFVVRIKWSKDTWFILWYEIPSTFIIIIFNQIKQEGAAFSIYFTLREGKKINTIQG